MHNRRLGINSTKTLFVWPCGTVRIYIRDADVGVKAARLFGSRADLAASNDIGDSVAQLMPYGIYGLNG
jgi:hypothetical protein